MLQANVGWVAFRALGVGLACFLLAVPGCGGSGGTSGNCRYESWTGRCKLTNVRTARVIERFPKAFIVVEALYEPVSTGGPFPPPPFRREIMALAENEVSLTAHLRNFPEVDCAVQNPVGDPCAPQMAANVPEFTPAGADPALTGPVGCAKIEQSGNLPPPASVTMPGPFQFETNSAAETPDIARLADEAARVMRSDPRIECVAVKPKTAPGEPFELANARAQAVKRLLESRGIDRNRVTVFEGTAPTYTAAPDADQPNPVEQRRVHLTVVVYGK